MVSQKIIGNIYFINIYVTVYYGVVFLGVVLPGMFSIFWLTCPNSPILPHSAHNLIFSEPPTERHPFWNLHMWTVLLRLGIREGCLKEELRRIWVKCEAEMGGGGHSGSRKPLAHTSNTMVGAECLCNHCRCLTTEKQPASFPSATADCVMQALWRSFTNCRIKSATT